MSVKERGSEGVSFTHAACARKTVRSRTILRRISASVGPGAPREGTVGAWCGWGNREVIAGCRGLRHRLSFLLPPPLRVYTRESYNSTFAEIRLRTPIDRDPPRDIPPCSPDLTRLTGGRLIAYPRFTQICALSANQSAGTRGRLKLGDLKSNFDKIRSGNLSQIRDRSSQGSPSSSVRRCSTFPVLAGDNDMSVAL